MSTVRFDVVIPTLGRPSLERLLAALAAQVGPRPDRVLVIEDERGRGPAATRNVGWRAAQAPWIVFLDDDVLPPRDWSEALVRDLASLPPAVGGSQGRVHVPLPAHRPPTDWERNVAGLEDARWISADIAYRRSVLEQVGGFDERFPRAYREDSDLALRVLALGFAIEQGSRVVEHPPGPSSFWRSVALQRGNADDALMRRLHGSGWRDRAGSPPGRLGAHLAIATSALMAVALASLGRKRGRAATRGPRLAAALGALAAGGVGELAWRRIAPGPRDGSELARMIATSAVIPFAASLHRLVGEIRWRGAQPLAPAAPGAVLFDRDGTLIEDVPYNGDPDLVTPRPGARQALRALRRAGVPVAVISNQSGVARGLISEEQVRAVNERAEELLGAVGGWFYCPHGPEDGCECRKPAPGLIVRAAEALGVPATSCAVIGDIGADVQAALAAGARAVLVPNDRTRREEVAMAPARARDLPAAVELLMGVGVR